MKLSTRLNQISPFIVMEVLEKAQELESEGIDVVHMEVGEPDFDTPEVIKEACNKALKNGHSHYTHSLGIPSLRKAIAKEYSRKYGLNISPDTIIITSGSSSAIQLALQTLCDSDDEVIITDPGYACYANFIRSIGAIPVSLNLSPDDKFKIHLDQLEQLINEKTKAIIITSPSNPIGNIIPDDILKKLAALSIPIISDEIYHGLEYGSEQAHTILKHNLENIVVSGFSKLYAMTGLRIGYMIVPRELVRPVQLLQQNLFICAASTAQHGALAAIHGAQSDVALMVATYDERRKFLIKRLKEIGFGIPVEPVGAFYIFADARFLNKNSYDLAFDILNKAHVGVTPGTDFGKNGEGFLRFSYANSIARLREGCDRLETYVKNITKKA